MDKLLFLSILLSVSAFTEGNHGNVTDDDDTGGSFPHAAVSSSVGSLIFIVLIVWLIYYCCNRNQAPEGFSQFNNENERNPPTGRSRWRNRRFFRRNRRQNHYQNNAEARNNTNITIQPVLTLGIPSGDQNSEVTAGEGRTAPFAPMAPPAYDDSVNNRPIPSQFMNPPMPNHFANLPMSSQYMNPTAPSQFMNYMPNNFANPQMSGNLQNQCMPNNIEQSKNPNALSYYTKH